VLDHSIGVHAFSSLAQRLRFEMREDVHPSRVEPYKERLVFFDRRFDELLRGLKKLFVNGRHALGVQWTGVLDLLSTLAIGVRMKNAARPILFLELRVFRIEVTFGFLLGIEMV
jgi:hypothetical protein